MPRKAPIREDRQEGRERRERGKSTGKRKAEMRHEREREAVEKNEAREAHLWSVRLETPEA